MKFFSVLLSLLQFAHIQAVAATTFNSAYGNIISDSSGNQVSVFPANEFKVQEEGTQIFDDTYDLGLDTGTRWNAAVAVGGGVQATNSSGSTALGTGTTANGYSYIQSQYSFKQQAPGWIQMMNAVNLENPITANSYRFWGFGSVPGSPTATAPLTDAIGFEVGTTGVMSAVSYSGGSRNLIQDLSSGTGNGKQPSDTAVHKYFVWFRGDLSYWAIDSVGNIVATMATGAPGPVINSLPLTMLAVAANTPPVSNTSLTSNALFVADTSRSGYYITDGTFGWRKATVSSSGALSTLSSLGNTTGKTNIFISSTAATAAVAGNTVVLSSRTTTSGKTFYLQHVDVTGFLNPPSTTTVVNMGSVSIFSPSAILVSSMSFLNSGSSPVVWKMEFAEPVAIASGTVITSSVTSQSANAATWITNFIGYEK